MGYPYPNFCLCAFGGALIPTTRQTPRLPGLCLFEVLVQVAFSGQFSKSVSLPGSTLEGCLTIWGDSNIENHPYDSSSRFTLGLVRPIDLHRHSSPAPGLGFRVY